MRTAKHGFIHICNHLVTPSAHFTALPPSFEAMPLSSISSMSCFTLHCTSLLKVSHYLTTSLACFKLASCISSLLILSLGCFRVCPPSPLFCSLLCSLLCPESLFDIQEWCSETAITYIQISQSLIHIFLLFSFA